VLVALVPSEVGSERAATVIGWSIAAAGVGGPAATAASGLVADRAGVSAVPVVLVLAAVLLVVLDAAFLFRHGDESQRHLVRQPAAGGSTRA
jgi:fucose permease